MYAYTNMPRGKTNGEGGSDLTPGGIVRFEDIAARQFSILYTTHRSFFSGAVIFPPVTEKLMFFIMDNVLP